MRIDFLVTHADDLNAIDQATTQLAYAVARAGHTVQVVPWRRRSLVSQSDKADVLVVPYNPFMWGRWGFAPALVRDLGGVRRRRPRPLLVLIVHEPFVPINSLKSLVMGCWQRAQLVALVLMADRLFASIEPWALRLSKLRPTGHLPSGSNLPDARTARAATRAELNMGTALVIASLSTGHPSHLTTYVEASLRRLADDGLTITFLRLGAGSSPVCVPEGVREVAPGYLSEERLAAYLAAADILLTPFVDGVSTRRGSFMAGICEGIAIVGTSGPLTDPMLLGQGLRAGRGRKSWMLRGPSFGACSE